MTESNRGPENDLAEDFINENYRDLDGNLILRYRGKRFFLWDDGIYKEIDSEEVKLSFTSWINKKQFRGIKNSRHLAEEALHRVRAKTRVDSKEEVGLNRYLNQKDESNYIAFENGVVRVNDILEHRSKVVTVRDHSPEFFNLAKIPFNFDPAAKSRLWKNILDRVIPNPEDQKLLQQWFGYHLMPSLSHSKMMIFEGSGANGKSVILLILRLMLGEENVSSLPLSSFDYDKPFKLAVTEGKLANICEEMGPSGPRIEETIKQFVNGGAFTVEKKFKDPFTLYPTAKLTFATNEMPSFSDRSSGLWRRMLFIKFSVTIPTHEQNKNYLERGFWISSGELSGILNWAIEGAKEILKNSGFSVSVEKLNEIEALRTEADLIRPWVRDNLEVGNTKEYVPTTEILTMFNEDIKNGLLPRVSQRELFKEIKAQFPKSHRPNNAIVIPPFGKRARVICGIRKHTDDTDQR